LKIIAVKECDADVKNETGEETQNEKSGADADDAAEPLEEKADAEDKKDDPRLVCSVQTTQPSPRPLHTPSSWNSPSTGADHDIASFLQSRRSLAKFCA